MSKQILGNIHRLIRVATQEQPVNQQFLGDLKVAIEKEYDTQKRLPSKAYKPSSMNCIRNMFFQIIGAEPDVARSNSCLIGIVESGSARHEHLQKYISKMKEHHIDCEYIDVKKFIKSRGLDYLEIKSQQGYETHLWHRDLNISFMADGIIRYLNKYYVLEIKTETIYKWQSREGVAEEHILQGTAYSICFGIDQVLFLYENRDNCDKKTYILQITDHMKYRLISKIEECDQYVKQLKVPPKPKNITKKECQYCRYVSLCRKAGK